MHRIHANPEATCRWFGRPSTATLRPPARPAAVPWKGERILFGVTCR